MKMIIISNIYELQKQLTKLSNKTIGFIPTMGALHEGHLSLVRKSKQKNDITIVSIFVNPKQFGPKEDLSKYPQPFEKDKELLNKEKVDILFYPNIKTMYPDGFQTNVINNKLANILEGKSRPGHFSGMATVVLKLFNVVSPTNAYFGQKDFQQSVIVKQMVNDFNLPINIDVVTTVRDNDGLALSSRNIFLNHEERLQSLCLYQSLLLAKKLISNGEKNIEIIKTQMKNLIKKHRLIRLDYIEICDQESLASLKVIQKKSVILIAAYVGKTRLIDNITIE